MAENNEILENVPSTLSVDNSNVNAAYPGDPFSSDMVVGLGNSQEAAVARVSLRQFTTTFKNLGWKYYDTFSEYDGWRDGADIDLSETCGLGDGEFAIASATITSGGSNYGDYRDLIRIAAGEVRNVRELRVGTNIFTNLDSGAVPLVNSWDYEELLNLKRIIMDGTVTFGGGSSTSGDVYWSTF